MITVSASQLSSLQQVIDDDQIPLTSTGQTMANAIRARHGETVQALIFYGSALREGSADKMLDFYVIVDNYHRIYGRGIRALAGWLLPPNVHFLQITDSQGRQLRSKYAIISARAFDKRTRGGALESMLWARFTQPAIIVTEQSGIYNRLRNTLALACAHFYRQSAPLLSGPVDFKDVWTRGLQESYRTELRPEDPAARSISIVARFPERYKRLSDILMPQDNNGRLVVQEFTPWQIRRCYLNWWLRRVTGKPRGAMRVLKGMMTFDGGLDYILEKVADHSGVRIDVSDHARRYPILHAPVIAWRLYRAGAFR